MRRIHTSFGSLMRLIHVRRDVRGLLVGEVVLWLSRREPLNCEATCLRDREMKDENSEMNIEVDNPKRLLAANDIWNLNSTLVVLGEQAKRQAHSAPLLS